MEAHIAKCRFELPPFCNWTPEEWEDRGHEYDEIRETGLGWDITDYGLNDFENHGLSLITIRNGKMNDEKYIKPYCEKLLFMLDGQVMPTHFHWSKMEDIINRGGGNARIKLYNSTEDGGLADTDVTVHKDGRVFTVPAGSEVQIKPGESITLMPYVYHSFIVEKGTGDVLMGEVSMTNDDNNDNRFYDPVGRFPEIEEDEAPYRLLCNEYPPAK